MFDDMFGNVCYKYEKPHNIKEWEDHIFSLLDSKFYQKIDVTMFDKLELSDSIEPSKRDSFYQDLVLFILLTLYFEIPYTFLLKDKYDYYQDYYKQKRKKTSELVKDIQEIQGRIKELVPSLKRINLSDRNTTKEHINNLLLNYQNNSDEISHLLSNTSNTVYILDNKFTYDLLVLKSRKLKSKTGIRDLSLRYIMLILQMSFFNVSRPLYEVAYKLLDMILPNDKENNSMMYSMTLDDIPKYIKDNIKQYKQDQKLYKHEFLGLKNHIPYIPEDRQDLDEYTERNNTNTRINPYLMEWKENSVMFLYYLFFRGIVTESLNSLFKVVKKEDSD